MPAPDTGTQSVETGLTVARISSYDASTARLRDVAKWFATSTVAFVAFLAAAFPIAGIVSDVGSVTWLGVVLGLVILVALGYVVALAAQVLAPQVVTVDAVATEPELDGLRTQIDGAPYLFLGLWADDVAGFVDRRSEVFEDQRIVRGLLGDPGSGLAPEVIEALRERLRQIERDLSILGWVAYRVESAGLYALTWRRFRRLRVHAALAVLVASASLVLLVASVREGASVQYAGSPVTVTFLDSVEPDPTSLLGVDCPETVDGELVSAVAEPPWTVHVDQAGCDPVTLNLTADQAVLVIHDAP
ncbi:hypothetical protein [Cellulosimicrobium arenosum]|uniref:Uncharacterized protein n=1 Tax=Cellulosimicrobium arenosum TaxID=2708133 RepID=A0A927G8M1_9MICO|nr:hypothetical protein [Cellulosimicrobium arenosum]MBD8078973.1 hypothetical protein [Cellulosimicrobium arenosum]